MKKLILTMCLTAAGVFGAAAQMRLTLGEALDLALSENPTVKVAEMEVQRFDYVKRQTWGSWDTSDFGRRHLYPLDRQAEHDKGLSFGADNTLAAQGDATWTLFAPAVFRTLKMNDVQRLPPWSRRARRGLRWSPKSKRPSITFCWPSSRSKCSANLRPPCSARGRHQIAVRQRTCVGIRPAYGAGAAEQPEALDPADREFDPLGQADAQNVPFDP